MLLKNRLPGIEDHPVEPVAGLEHIKPAWVMVARWLVATKVEYVLIGAAAEAVRGNRRAEGPVTIVPAPYRRNLERLARALASEHARMRVQTGGDPVPVKITAEQLAERTRWTLRCGRHDLDIEAGIKAAGGASEGVPSYQELLYEAGRFQLEPGLSVEVASPEDLEHFAHLHRTGLAPQIRITRQASPAVQQQEQPKPDTA